MYIMTNKELVVEVFDEIGYSIRRDERGNMFVCYQMKNIFISFGECDDSYIVMTLPCFHEFDAEDEHLMLAVCNKLTHDFRMVKVCMDSDSNTISAYSGFYYSDERSLKLSIENSLQIFGILRPTFEECQEKLAADE